MPYPNSPASPPARRLRQARRRMLELLAGALIGAITIAILHSVGIF